MLEAAFAVQGEGLDEATLVGFSGSEAISRCFELDVFVTLPDPTTLDGSLGTALSLTINHRDPPYSLGGVVAEVEVLHEMAERTLVRLRMVPRLWPLGLSEHSRMFTDKSVPDIVKDVLTAAGLSEGTDFELRLSGSYDPCEHVCQYHESDLSFVQRWLEHEGIHYFFEHEDGVDKLVMCDDSGQATALAPEAVRYHPVGDDDDDASAGDAFRRFSTQRQSRPADVTLTDYDYMRPVLEVSGEAAALERGFGSLVDHGDDRFIDPSRGAALAGVRAGAELSRQALVEAEGTVSHLRPGYRVELAEHPVEGLNGEYLCVAVEHVANLRARTAELSRLTGLPMVDVYRARMQAVPADRRFRPARATPWPRVDGYITAVVDGPADSDYAQLDDAGRYRVILRLDESGLDGGKASTALRMMQPHAGNPEGMHFPLRKGTEVLVACLDGDPDRPLIVGAVPDAHNPSVVTEQNHTHNVVHTGGNNRFDFEDQDGSQWITFSSPTEDTYLHLGAPVDDRTHHIVMHTDGDCLFDYGSNQDILVGGKLDETVEGSVTETYNATQTSLVEGSQTTTVNATCTETYNSTQTTLTIGQVTESYHVPHNTTVNAAPRSETFLATQTTNVTGGVTQQLNGTHTRTVVGPTTSTLGSYTRHVTGAVTQIYGASAMRLWGPNEATFASLNMVVPGGVTTIHAEHVLEAPSDTWIDLVTIKTAASKIEVAHLWHGGCILKLEACGVAIAGIAAKVEGTGLGLAINGFTTSLSAEEIEPKGGTHLHLCAIVVKV